MKQPPLARGAASALACLMVAGCAGGAAGTPVATPTAPPSTMAATASPAAPVQPSPSTAARSHVLSTTADDGVGITVSISGPGWAGQPGSWQLEWGPLGGDPPNGAGIITYTVDEEFFVFGDPCAWSTTTPQTPVTTVADLAAALAKQPGRAATGPEDITVGGFAGRRVTLHVPDDADFAACDDDRYASFGVTGEVPARWHQGPGQIDEMWIIDVHGKIALMDGAYYAATATDVVDELHRILQSATFDLAGS